MKLATITLALLMLSGCSTFQPIVSRASGLVKDYCVQPLDQRLLIRAQVNQAIAPNAAKITCFGDPN